jgi:Ca-activated chloride channel family protein
MVFANPIYLWLLLLLVPMIGWYIWKLRKSQASIQLSSLEGFEKAPNTFRIYLRHLPFICRLLALAFLIIAMARPQTTDKWNTETTEGIDIMMSLDISSSMLAQDLRPDRLKAAKDVAASFISGRRNDNIGLVVFAAESFTQCPLTTDHAVLLNLLKDVDCGMIEDGTAIGHGLATAVSRLKDSKAKSKVIILLTDGTNNRGEIAPVTAAQIAQAYGIRVYTIAVGTIGEAPYPYPMMGGGVRMQMMKVEIDEKTLTQIAQITGGRYFRATNNKALVEIYKEIDLMEKTKMSVQEYSKKQEEYARYAMIGLLFFLLELLLRYTIFKNIP